MGQSKYEEYLATFMNNTRFVKQNLKSNFDSVHKLYRKLKFEFSSQLTLCISKRTACSQNIFMYSFWPFSSDTYGISLCSLTFLSGDIQWAHGKEECNSADRICPCRIATPSSVGSPVLLCFLGDVSHYHHRKLWLNHSHLERPSPSHTHVPIPQ